MIDIKKGFRSKFPEFTKSEEFLSKIIDLGDVVEIPEGTAILNVGDYVKVIPFLVDGLIKIYREDDDGNEILLYYINSGESCVMSITTSIKDEPSSLKAMVEENSSMLLVPRDAFIALLKEFNILHNFVYDLFNSKYNELIKSIDSLAFTNTKTRVFDHLLRESEVKKSKVIKGLTHKSIATDLSTSREVVSRLLYALQKEGKIQISNKIITITD